MSYIIRTAISILLLMALASCSNDPMTDPITASEQLELTQSLLDLKGELSADDYAELIDAIATVRNFDLESLTIEEYFASLNGKTPIDIIAQAAEINAGLAPGVKNPQSQD